jgi:hypothetical protein
MSSSPFVPVRRPSPATVVRTVQAAEPLEFPLPLLIEPDSAFPNDVGSWPFSLVRALGMMFAFPTSVPARESGQPVVRRTTIDPEGTSGMRQWGGTGVACLAKRKEGEKCTGAAVFGKNAGA